MSLPAMVVLVADLSSDPAIPCIFSTRRARWFTERPSRTTALENDELSVIKTHLSHSFGIHDKRTPHADAGSGGGRSSAISSRMRPSGECYWGTEGFQKSGGHNSPEEPFAWTIDVATSAPFASNDDPSAVKGCPTNRGATCSF